MNTRVNCLAPSTLVYTDEGVLPVSALVGREFTVKSLNIYVKDSNIGMGVVEKRATASMSGYKQLVRVCTSVGDFEVTYDHRMLTRKGHYMPAKSLKPGMLLTHQEYREIGSAINDSGEDAEIISVKKITSDYVYYVEVQCDSSDDLSWDDWHNFAIAPKGYPEGELDTHVVFVHNSDQ